MPWRAVSVSTGVVTVVRMRLILWSHNAKKNVLFFTIGPPPLTVYWLVFLQSIGVGLGFPVSGSRLLLFSQLFADSAVFRLLHTADPLNSFVPERVSIYTCYSPRLNVESSCDGLDRMLPV